MIPSLKSQVEIEVVGDSSFLQWEKATKDIFYKNVRKYMYGNNEETCFKIYILVDMQWIFMNLYNYLQQ